MKHKKTASGNSYDLWLYEPLKVLIRHTDHFRMGAGIEEDFIIFRQMLIRVDIHSVEVAERRHGANLAIREHAPELPFADEFNLPVAHVLPEMVEIDGVVGRQHRHGHVSVNIDDNGFR